MLKNQIINKYILPILYLLSWVIFYFLPANFLCTGLYQGGGYVFVTLLFFFLNPLLLYLALKKNGVTSKSSRGITYATVLFLIFPSFAFSDKCTKELEEYGEITVGVIDEAYMQRSRRSRAKWRVIAKYKVNGETYKTTPTIDKDKNLMLGDTVTVRYSTNYPSISEINDLKFYYDY